MPAPISNWSQLAFYNSLRGAADQPRLAFTRSKRSTNRTCVPELRTMETGLTSRPARWARRIGRGRGLKVEAAEQAARRGRALHVNGLLPERPTSSLLGTRARIHVRYPHKGHGHRCRMPSGVGPLPV
mgnify:FL=1